LFEMQSPDVNTKQDKDPARYSPAREQIASFNFPNTPIGDLRQPLFATLLFATRGHSAERGGTDSPTGEKIASLAMTAFGGLADEICSG
jgi:hypothetical protein